MRIITLTHLSELYEQDFHAWALHNAGLIRAGRWEQIDRRHLAEELEDMGAGKQQQLETTPRTKF
jgi:hypothetical protein